MNGPKLRLWSYLIVYMKLDMVGLKFVTDSKFSVKCIIMKFS